MMKDIFGSIRTIAETLANFIAVVLFIIAVNLLTLNPPAITAGLVFFGISALIIIYLILYGEEI